MQYIKRKSFKETTYLIYIDVFMLISAMGVTLGIVLITLNPEFGVLNKKGTTETSNEVFEISINKQRIHTMILNSASFSPLTEEPDVDRLQRGKYYLRIGNDYYQIIEKIIDRITIFYLSEDNNNNNNYLVNGYRGSNSGNIIPFNFNENDILILGE